MYGDFAGVYDSLMEDAEYGKRAKLLKELFKKYDRMPSLMLDLACGTGGFSREFAAEGVSVIGVDVSADMLSVAQEKSEGADILYLCQDMTKLDLYGTVDGAVCCLDSLNHLENEAEFAAALKKVSLFLEKDRLFIFDLNTPYKHKTVLGDNIFIKENEKVFCVWQNEYEEKDLAVNITLDFFLKDGDSYIRKSDSVREIAFSENTVAAALSSAGLRLETRLDGETGKEVNSASERIIYVVRKE